jgi:undecaprenyl-phosphate 4-deoxy-4-formamido-L-arabinose transferase
LCGINFSDGKIVITIDDDLQIPPEEIQKLIDTYEKTGADLIYGVFEEKKHSILRNVGSRMFNFFFSRLANTTGKGSSFRLITTDLSSRLRGINQKYLLLDEVLQWFTNNIAYCPVEHQKRTKGKSGYSVFNLISITFKYVIYYTVLPLRLMTYIGFFFSLFAFVGAVFYVYRWLLLDVQPGFTTTILAIFFSTSIILFSLGIIGEYVSRIYVQEISKPPYVVKEIL